MTCHCGNAELVEHPDTSPHKAGFSHCAACGCCFNGKGDYLSACNSVIAGDLEAFTEQGKTRRTRKPAATKSGGRSRSKKPKDEPPATDETTEDGNNPEE